MSFVVCCLYWPGRAANGNPQRDANAPCYQHAASDPDPDGNNDLDADGDLHAEHHANGNPDTVADGDTAAGAVFRRR